MVDKYWYEYNKDLLTEEQAKYFMLDKSYMKYVSKDSLIGILMSILLVCIWLYMLEIIFVNINIINIFNHGIKFLDQIWQMWDMVIWLLFLTIILILLNFIDVLFDTSLMYFIFYPFLLLRDSLNK